MNQRKQVAGHLGGTQTLNRHGKEYYQAIGRLGGRKRLPTLAELRQRQSLEGANAKNNKKEAGLANSYPTLKALWKSQNNHEPGGVDLSPIPPGKEET